MPDHESLEIPIQYPGHRVTNPQPPSFTSAEIQDFSDDLEAIEEAERAARILEHDPDHLLASATEKLPLQI